MLHHNLLLIYRNIKRFKHNVFTVCVDGVAALGIAILTVGFQAFKAAIVNPVESLKT
jgi:hypothetical protein